LQKSALSNLLIITHFPFPHFGGVATAVSNEIAFLTKKGYDIFFMFPPSTGFNEKRWNLKNLHLIPQSSSPNTIYNIVSKIRRCSTIGKIVTEKQIQKILTHDVHSAFLCVMAGKRKNTLLYLHSILSKDPSIFGRPFSDLTFSEKVSYLVRYYINFLIELFTYNLVRVIICVSEYEKKDAELKCLSKRKIYLVRNGVDASVFRPNLRKKRKTRILLNIPNEKKVCMFLGRMNPSKGVLTIVKSIPHLKDLEDEVSFIFVGEGPDKEIAKEYVLKKGFENVLFLEAKNAEDLLPAADVFISHVSSLIIGYGRTILEAMVSEIPVITGRDSIKEKVFCEDKEIIFVKKDNPKSIAEEIRQLISNNERRRIIGKEARKRTLKDFSVEENMEKFEKISKLLTNT